MYIKRLKLEILSEIVDNSNAYEIASELTEYVRDINPVMAREAVKAVGRVALAVCYSLVTFLAVLFVDRCRM